MSSIVMYYVFWNQISRSHLTCYLFWNLSLCMDNGNAIGHRHRTLPQDVALGAMYYGPAGAS